MGLQRKLIKGCGSIFCIILFFIAITAGCSSSNKAVEPNESLNNNNKAVAPTEINRQITNGHDLTFPISDDPRLLGLHNRASMVGKLRANITDYKRATGVYPASISEYINSGFPLFWPRNVMDGLPVRVLTSRDVTNDPSDFGSIKWGKDGAYNVLISSNIDLAKYKDCGEVSWIVETTGLHDLKGTFTKGITTIVGGTNTINRVSDPETKMLYAKCGEITDFIFGTTHSYYSVYKSLPNNIIDNLAFQQDLGSTPFIIKENFDKLARELKDADVELKIGYDYPNTVSYALLKINGETLISHCYKYDYNAYEDPPIEDDSPGIHVGYRMEDIDMSSPMISNANLSALNIPDQFLISIEDIPIEY